VGIIAIIALTSMDDLPENEPPVTQENDDNVTIEPQQQPNRNSISYFIYPLPDHADHDLTISNISKAFDEWSNLNPQLKYVQVNDVNKANISIEFVEEIKDIYEVSGITYTDLDTGINEILIDFGNSDCNNDFVFWDSNHIEDILKHEIGHTLNLEHSSDPAHLMYDPDDGLLLFNNLRYSIPETDSNDFFIGQKSLNIQFEQLDSEITSMDKRIDLMEEENNGVDGIELDRINDLINFRNNKALEQSLIADKINCYPNMESP
jgi:hypothetical protein